MDEKHIFNSDIIRPPKRGAWKLMLPILLVLLVGLALAYHFGWSVKITAAGAVLLGFGSGLVVWLLGMITLVPIIGPILVKILTMSIIWLLNAIGYLVSYVAIHRGYSKDVLTYRIVTIALLSGIVIGYVIGSFFS